MSVDEPSKEAATEQPTVLNVNLVGHRALASVETCRCWSKRQRLEQQRLGQVIL